MTEYALLNPQTHATLAVFTDYDDAVYVNSTRYASTAVLKPLDTPIINP